MSQPTNERPETGATEEPEKTTTGPNPGGGNNPHDCGFGPSDEPLNKAEAQDHEPTGVGASTQQGK